MIHLSALLLVLSLLGGPAQAAPTAAPAPVPAQAFRFGSDRFCSEIGRLLAAHFSMDGDLQVELLRPWNPPARTAAVWQVVVTEFPATSTALMLIRCQLLADGSLVDDVSLMVRAALWRDAWFARQPISSGAVFNPALLDSRRVDVLRVRDALPVTAGDRSNVFSRDIGADRMLTWHDLGRRPLVRKGELVEATAREGSLYVAMKALAMENGARGDIIALRNPESHKEIYAQVVDDDHVEIRF